MRAIAAACVLALAACSTSQRPPERSTIETLRGFEAVRPRVDARVAPLPHPGGFATPPSASGALFGAVEATWAERAEGISRLTVSGRPGTWIELESEGVTGTGRIEDGALVFAGAAPDLDVIQVIDRTSVEELRLLRSPRAPNDLRIHARLGPDLARLRARDGRVEAIDEHGATRLATDRIFAVDARGVRRDLAVRVEGEARSYTVVAVLDTRDLAYPIVIDPAWSTAGSMSAPRDFASGTITSTGKVLVYSDSTSEVYDPGTNTWGSVTPTKVVRYKPALAPLPGGKVLAVGGDSTAEVWDPATSTWSLVAPMSATRNQPLSAPLAGGKVLVVGGFEASDVSTAEIYDSTTNSWTATTSMHEARSGDDATALALSSGKVLVIGNTNGDVYDPATSTWTAATVPGGGMFSNWVVATQLTGGKVLVVDGARALLYDPATNAIKLTAAVPTPGGTGRYAEGVARLPNGRALFAGGTAPGFGLLDDAWLYDPVKDAWIAAGNMDTTRIHVRAFPLASGKALVFGGYVSAKAQLFGLLANGAACVGGFECDSTSCVDGVCCASSACAADETCASPTASGSCRKKNGAVCTTSSQCGSGTCVDGRCCDKACNGQCEACDVMGSLGKCIPVVGAPHGTRTACGGAGAGTTCGAACNGVDVSKCVFPPATKSCGTAGCTGGVETHASTCNGSGLCNDTPKACAPYACGATTCKTTCSSTLDCTAGFYCKSGSCVPAEGLGKDCTKASDCTTGFCTDGVCCGVGDCGPGLLCSVTGHRGTCIKANGTTCTGGAECGSGLCQDGVCCDRACDGQCEACDVAAKVGTCSPVVGAPHGARTACADGADICGKLACDGAKDAAKCVAFASGTDVPCATAKCEGSSFTGAATCDGAGACGKPETTSCVPYTCEAMGCRIDCTSDAHCITGFACKDGKCAPRGAQCSSDRLDALDPDGKSTSCSPYLCTDGVCGTGCATTDECASGFVCNPITAACTQPVPESADTDASGGCAMPPSPTNERAPSRSAAIAVLALIGLGLVRRSR